MNDESRGQIITFYSYKGGTGRTMALANIACVLAERQGQNGGKGVLMIDWDLEAPGLHRFFRNQLSGKTLVSRRLEDPHDSDPGLIDLFDELQKKMDRSNEEKYKEERSSNLGTLSLSSEKWARATINDMDLQRYILPTTIKSLYLLKAGRFSSKDSNEYSERVNKFNWEALYTKSPHLIRVFAEVLAERYAYVLIDSRTGVTDISGICTMLLPEKLVVVFTPNMQSLQGALDLIHRATEYRKESADLRPLLVFPLVSRVEANESDLRHDWRFGNLENGLVGYQSEFEQLLAEVYDKKEVKLTGYFDEMQIQHIPRYAYGEEIAVLIEKSGDKFSLRRSYHTFAQKLIEARVPWEGEITAHDALDPKPGKLSRMLRGLCGDLNSKTARKSIRMASVVFILFVAMAGSIFSFLQTKRYTQTSLSLAIFEQENSFLNKRFNELNEQLKVLKEQEEETNQLRGQLKQLNIELATAKEDAAQANRNAVEAQKEAAVAQAELERFVTQYQKSQRAKNPPNNRRYSGKN